MDKTYEKPARRIVAGALLVLAMCALCAEAQSLWLEAGVKLLGLWAGSSAFRLGASAQSK